MGQHDETFALFDRLAEQAQEMEPLEAQEYLRHLLTNIIQPATMEELITITRVWDFYNEEYERDFGPIPVDDEGYRRRVLPAHGG